MSINKNNYELYLVDYSEGNLLANDMRMVDAFLAENPDIKAEFEFFLKDVPIDTENKNKEIPFSGKELLKSIPYENSSIDSELFQQQCVARIENLLSVEEQNIFDQALINYPEKQKEYNIFSKTILNAEKTTYNEKLILMHASTSHVINPENFNEYCVACTEGWLNQSGMLALNAFIAANPTYKNTYNLHQQIKFWPNYNIGFPDKNKLKKFRILRFVSAKTFSMVASAAAVLTIGYFVIKSPELKNNMHTVTTIQEPNHKTITEPTKKQQQQNFTKQTNYKTIEIPVKQALAVAKTNKTKSRTTKLSLEVIKPKTINYIECTKCTQVNNYNFEIFEAKQTRRSKTVISKKASNTTVITPKMLANSLLKNGATKVEKIIKGNINISRNENNKKAKFEISTKYLAISTNIGRTK